MKDRYEKKRFNSKVINASEIGEFQYCSISWFLKKQGYKPESDFIDQGIIKHKKLGETIDITRRNLKKSRLLNLLGFILLALGFFILVFEVII